MISFYRNANNEMVFKYKLLCANTSLFYYMTDV